MYASVKAAIELYSIMIYLSFISCLSLAVYTYYGASVTVQS